MKIACKIEIYLLFLIFIFPDLSVAFMCSEAKSTLKVIDERAYNISGAKVHIGFFCINNKIGNSNFHGISDGMGLFTAVSLTHGEFSYLVEHEGYYDTHGEYKGWLELDQGVKNGRWEPWNPTIEVKLKKIIKPVPMYAKRVRINIPVLEKEVGYDFEKGDWVTPYGKGITNDIIFSFTGRFIDYTDREESLAISFSNEKDGILEYISDPVQVSELRLPHKAPLDGYLNKLTLEKYIKPSGRKNMDIVQGQNYIFRVRSIVDKDGKIVKANYGKINGGIEYGFDTEKTAGVVFTYYFNPDTTRNLEFDPKRNLFSDLKSTEEVTAP
jgi:hypothetical protein